MKNQQTTQSLHKWLLILYSQALNFHFPLFFFFHYISPVSIIRIKVGGKLFISIFIVDAFPQTHVKIKGQGFELWPQAAGLWTLSSTLPSSQTSGTFWVLKGLIQLLLLHSNLPSTLLSLLQSILYLLKDVG